MKLHLKDKFNKMSKGSVLFGMAAALMAGSVSAGINGSVHDFTGKSWTYVDGNGQICVYCHTPHNAKTADAPLWNHAITSATFTPYSSSTLDASVGQPDGVSKMCLSCHDGTVSLDSYGDLSINLGSTKISGVFNLGTDLSNDHPVSFVYDTTLVNADKALNDPSTAVTIGDPNGVTKDIIIGGLLDSNNKLQCSTCHDVHNKFAILNMKLLRVTLNGSALCLTCHAK